MAVKALPMFVLVTNSKEKEYEKYGAYGGYYGSSSKPTEIKLCVTGETPTGQKVWFKVNPDKVPYGKPTDLIGSVLTITAKVSGQSDDGQMQFLNYVKVLQTELNPYEVQIESDDALLSLMKEAA